MCIRDSLDTVRQHLAEAVNTVEKVSIALNSWMVAFNTDHPGKPLDLNQLRALLHHNNEWIQQERRALQKLIADVQNAEATLKERQSQRQDHERQRAGSDSLEAVQTAQQHSSDALKAVSYTHLDVYKRQGSGCRGR